jgi:hypothetical protein
LKGPEAFQQDKPIRDRSKEQRISMQIKNERNHQNLTASIEQKRRQKSTKEKLEPIVEKQDEPIRKRSEEQKNSLEKENDKNYENLANPIENHFDQKNNTKKQISSKDKSEPLAMKQDFSSTLLSKRNSPIIHTLNHDADEPVPKKLRCTNSNITNSDKDMTIEKDESSKIDESFSEKEDFAKSSLIKSSKRNSPEKGEGNKNEHEPALDSNMFKQEETMSPDPKQSIKTEFTSPRPKQNQKKKAISITSSAEKAETNSESEIVETFSLKGRCAQWNAVQALWEVCTKATPKASKRVSNPPARWPETCVK